MFVNLPGCVWIIFHFNFKTFFWRHMLSGDICFLFTCPFRSFPKEPSIWFVILVACLRMISPRLRHSEQECSIISGLLFNFPEKFAEGPIRSWWQNVRGPYFWHLQCLWNFRLWLAVFTVLRLGKGDRYGFDISQKHRRLAFVFSLLVRLIWFCETAKLRKSVLSNFKRMT